MLNICTIVAICYVAAYVILVTVDLFRSTYLQTYVDIVILALNYMTIFMVYMYVMAKLRREINHLQT